MTTCEPGHCIADWLIGAWGDNCAAKKDPVRTNDGSGISTDILLCGCNVKEPTWKGSRGGDSFQHPDLKAEEKLITADIDRHAGWLLACILVTGCV